MSLKHNAVLPNSYLDVDSYLNPINSYDAVQCHLVGAVNPEAPLGSRASRRLRVFIPEHKKDTDYWIKRHRNNEAAKRSREKRRLNDAVMGQKIMELTNENKQLRMELAAIRRAYRSPSPSEHLDISSENQQSVPQGNHHLLGSLATIAASPCSSLVSRPVVTVETCCIPSLFSISRPQGSQNLDHGIEEVENYQHFTSIANGSGENLDYIVRKKQFELPKFEIKRSAIEISHGMRNSEGQIYPFFADTSSGSLLESSLSSRASGGVRSINTSSGQLRSGASSLVGERKQFPTGCDSLQFSRNWERGFEDIIPCSKYDFLMEKSMENSVGLSLLLSSVSSSDDDDDDDDGDGNFVKGFYYLESNQENPLNLSTKVVSATKNSLRSSPLEHKGSVLISKYQDSHNNNEIDERMASGTSFSLRTCEETSSQMPLSKMWSSLPEEQRFDSTSSLFQPVRNNTVHIDRNTIKNVHGKVRTNASSLPPLAESNLLFHTFPTHGAQPRQDALKCEMLDNHEDLYCFTQRTFDPKY